VKFLIEILRQRHIHVKTKLGRKQVLRCEAENILSEHCLLMERTDFMRLAYQLAVRNEIKNQFYKSKEKAGRKRLKNFLHRNPQISVRTPEGLSLSRARDFTPESVAQVFFKRTNPQWTPFDTILQDFTNATKPAITTVQHKRTKRLVTESQVLLIQQNRAGGRNQHNTTR
jgi:hypothetical protein